MEQCDMIAPKKERESTHQVDSFFSLESYVNNSCCSCDTPASLNRGLAVGLECGFGGVVGCPVYPAGDRPPQPSFQGVYPAIGTSDFPSSDSPIYLIPGVGEVTGDACGDVVRGAGCSVDVTHFWRAHPLSCDRRECPVCYDTALVKVAKKASDRVRGFGDAVAAYPAPSDLTTAQYREYSRIVKRSKTVLHVTISPPPGVITPEMEYEAIQKIGRDHAKKTGLVGGYYIFHPYRISDDVLTWLSLCNDTLRESGQPTMSYWDHVRIDSLGLGAWHRYVEWSPHWHLVGVGWLILASEYHDETGWIYKNIRPKGIRRDIEYDARRVAFLDEVAATIRYQLSHAAYIPGGRALREFGYLNTRYLKRIGDEFVKRVEESLCPVCKAPIVRYMADPDTGQPLGPDTSEGDYKPCFCRVRGWRYQFSFMPGER